MKKTYLFAIVLGICGLSRATTINAPSSLIGSDALSGENAYAWGLSIPEQAGQQVASFQINFNNITLTAANSSGVGYLYTDLINYSVNGVTPIADGDAPGDFFKTLVPTYLSAGQVTSAGPVEKFNKVGTTLSWSYNITGSLLTTLNAYLLAGGLTIGLDPDCHYTVGGISITYTLTPVTNTRVPDYASTALLMLGSFAALALFRRKLAVAK